MAGWLSQYKWSTSARHLCCLTWLTMFRILRILCYVWPRCFSFASQSLNCAENSSPLWNMVRGMAYIQYCQSRMKSLPRKQGSKVGSGAICLPARQNATTEFRTHPQGESQGRLFKECRDRSNFGTLALHHKHGSGQAYKESDNHLHSPL